MAALVAVAALVSIAWVLPVTAGEPSPSAVAAVPPVNASAAAAKPSLRLWTDCVTRVNTARAAAGR
ncbi:MAG: hypothetical protein ABMA25_02110, partial [Ilumatobacteraceae bacterium]